MREVEVHIWCDIHGQGTSADYVHVVAIDGAEPKALDLCEICDLRLFGELMEVVAEHGVTPEIVEPSTRAEPEDERTCPRCGLLVSTRQNLSRHCSRAHGVGLRELVRSGELAPATIQRKEAA